MSPLLPDRMTVERVADGMLYRMPRRDLGKIRGAGFVLVGMGILVTAFMVFWMWGPISGGLEGDDPARWFSLVFGLMGLPGLVVGLGLILVGSAVLRNALRSEVLVTRDQIISTEWFGPIRWRRKRRLADIDRLVLADALTSIADDSTETISLGADLTAIRAEGAGIKPMLIAPGYPKSLTEPLAQQLATAAGAGQPERLVAEDRPGRVPIIEEGSDGSEDVEDEATLQQPAGSKVVFQELAGGISIAIPPVGLWKGSKGMFGIAIFWNALCLIIFGSVAYGMIAKGELDLKETGMVAAFALAFIGVGVGLLLASIEMGRRQAAIATRNEELHIKRISPFKPREYRFRAGELKAICVGPSGMEVNDRPVMELQIQPVSGSSIGMLSQLGEEDLYWIAARLRHALHVPRRPRG